MPKRRQRPAAKGVGGFFPKNTQRAQSVRLDSPAPRRPATHDAVGEELAEGCADEHRDEDGGTEGGADDACSCADENGDDEGFHYEDGEWIDGVILAFMLTSCQVCVSPSDPSVSNEQAIFGAPGLTASRPSRPRRAAEDPSCQ